MNYLDINKLKKNLKCYNTVLVENHNITSNIALTICNDVVEEEVIINYNFNNNSYNKRYSSDYILRISEDELYDNIKKDISSLVGDDILCDSTKEVASDIIS